MDLVYVDRIFPGKWFVVTSDGSPAVLYGRPILDSRGIYVPDSGSSVLFSVKNLLPKVTKDALMRLLTDKTERCWFVSTKGHYAVTDSGNVFNLKVDNDFKEEV